MPRIRPNQLFAVSLPYSALTRTMMRARRRLLCARQLLTSYGLRSLSPRDPALSSDTTAAAHGNGMRPIIRARCGPGCWDLSCAHITGPTAMHRPRAVILEPVAEHLESACLGTISEIFEGDAPHAARGCFAQAWSVAEILRSWIQLEREIRKSPKSQVADAMTGKLSACSPIARPPRLEALGALSERAAVGHRARGLQSRTAPPGTIFRTTMPAAAPIAGARTASPASATRAAAVPVAGAVERRRPDPEGAAVRPDQREGNHGEDVKELYLLPRRDADAFLPEDALQVSAAGVSLRGTWSRRTRAAARTSRNSNCSIPACSTTTAISTCSSNMPKRPGRHSDAGHGLQSRARTRHRCICCRSCVSQHLVLGYRMPPSRMLRGVDEHAIAIEHAELG